MTTGLHNSGTRRIWPSFDPFRPPWPLWPSASKVETKFSLVIDVLLALMSLDGAMCFLAFDVDPPLRWKTGMVRVVT